MSLKSTLFFSILIITLIPNIVYGMTDQEVMAKYANPQELQNAIDKGVVDYNSLSDIMKNATHPYNPNASNHSFDMLTNLWIAIPLIFGLVFVKAFLSSRKTEDDYRVDNTDDSGTLPKGFPRSTKKKEMVHSPIHKLLLILGIIRVRSNA